MPNSADYPIHPGIILLEEIMKPMGISQYRLAIDLNVPIPRINAIVNGKRAISTDTALRLARYFETADDFWINLQVAYDLEQERAHLGSRLQDEIPVLATERMAP